MADVYIELVNYSNPEKRDMVRGDGIPLDMTVPEEDDQYYEVLTAVTGGKTSTAAPDGITHAVVTATGTVFGRVNDTPGAVTGGKTIMGGASRVFRLNPGDTITFDTP